jgi:hypothetical protein
MIKCQEIFKSILLLLAMIVTMLAIDIDQSIYSTASSKIMQYFKINNYEFKNISIVKNIGLVCGCLLIDILIVRYSKKALVLFGIATLIIVRTCSIFVSEFHSLLGLSFIAAMAKSVPSVLFVPILLDRASCKKIFFLPKKLLC